MTAQRFHNAANNGYVMMGTPVKSQEINDLNDHLTTTGFAGSDWPDYPFNNIKAYDETQTGLRDEGFVGTSGLGQNLPRGKGWMIYMAEGSQFIDLNVQFGMEIKIYQLPILTRPTLLKMDGTLLPTHMHALSTGMLAPQLGQKQT